MPESGSSRTSNCRVVDQGGGQFDPLPHALGITRDSAVCPANHADTIEGGRRALACLATGIAAQSSHRLDELSAGHLLVEHVAVRAVADKALGLPGPGIVPGDANSAQVRPKLASGQTQKSALARPVGPDQTGDAGPQFQRHLVDAKHRAIPFRDVLEE